MGVENNNIDSISSDEGYCYLLRGWKRVTFNVLVCCQHDTKVTSSLNLEKMYVK